MREYHQKVKYTTSLLASLSTSHYPKIQMNKKKYTLILAIFLTSQVWASNWILLGKNATVEVFIDLSSIKEESGLIKVKSYMNLLQSHNPNYKSAENEFSISCQENSYIESNPIIYSEYNRIGPVARGTVSQEKKIITNINSIPGAISQYACNKQQSNSAPVKPQPPSQLVKIKELLKLNWPQWDENTINDAIKFEVEKIKNKNPSLNEEQAINQTLILWESRANAKNKPPQEPAKIKNSVELADVHPLAWNHIYPIPNIQVCEPRIPNTKCIDFNTYKKSCAIAKNISHQAARLSTYTDQLPARLIERNGSFSNVKITWEGERCTFSYEVWANFNGKLEGCRVFGLATGFAISDQNKVVINMSSHLHRPPAVSTCRLN